MRRRKRRAAQELRRWLAVPLTSEEVTVLVTGLREANRVMRDVYWRSGGAPGAIGHAETMLRSSGIAAAHGQWVTPALVRDLPGYETWLGQIQRYQGDARVAAGFEQLIGKMRDLSGRAAACNWYAEPYRVPNCLQWRGTAPALEES